MGLLRRVSAADSREAEEVQMSGAVDNGNGTFTLTVGNIADWNGECDFITYARNDAGTVDEDTRVVWTGTKSNDTTIIATKTGGSNSYIPDSTNVAAPVPTHRWANDLIRQLDFSLPDDGKPGIKMAGSGAITFMISSSQPSAISGRTIIWLKPV